MSLSEVLFSIVLLFKQLFSLIYDSLQLVFINFVFDSVGIESLNDSVFPCLPLILMLLLRWSSKCKAARCYIMKEGQLNQHIHQLRILATHENTWVSSCKTTQASFYCMWPARHKLFY